MQSACSLTYQLGRISTYVVPPPNVKGVNGISRLDDNTTPPNVKRG